MLSASCGRRLVPVGMVGGDVGAPRHAPGTNKRTELPAGAAQPPAQKPAPAARRRAPAASSCRAPFWAARPQAAAACARRRSRGAPPGAAAGVGWGGESVGRSGRRSGQRAARASGPAPCMRLPLRWRPAAGRAASARPRHPGPCAQAHLRRHAVEHPHKLLHPLDLVAAQVGHSSGAGAGSRARRAPGWAKLHLQVQVPGFCPVHHASLAGREV